MKFFFTSSWSHEVHNSGNICGCNWGSASQTICDDRPVFFPIITKIDTLVIYNTDKYRGKDTDYLNFLVQELGTDLNCCLNVSQPMDSSKHLQTTL